MTLSKLIKSIKKDNKNMPSSKVILGLLKGSQYECKTVSDNIPDDMVTAFKKYINNEVKLSVKRKKEQAKEAKVFFYISIGGTPELRNTFKIELSDHLMKKTISPKGCDKYCTENQIGKPVNWIKLPVIVLNDYKEFDCIKMSLNENNEFTRIDTNVFTYDESGCDFISRMKSLRENISYMVNNNWFTRNYNR